MFNKNISIYFKKIFLAFAFFPMITSFWQGLVHGSFDYGDAPDGAIAYQNVIGKFPSKRLSNGARVKLVNKVWLGENVNKEVDSRQVDSDKGDDGLVLSDMASCAKTNAQFFVHIQNPKNTKNLGAGKAYLNLFVDWNKNGEWQGNDGCADEWVVKNYEVDLTKQTSVIAVYSPEFISGKNVKDLWMRAAVTLEEKFNQETGAGSFNSGEIEDYGPIILEPNYEADKYSFCSPKPLVLEHGTSANFAVIPAIGAAPILSVELTKAAKANVDREIKNVPTSPVANTFSYISKIKDGPNRVETDLVSLSVTHVAKDGREIKYILSCPILIKHKEERIIIDGPPKKFPPTKPKFIETQSPANPKSGVGDRNPALNKSPSFDAKFQKYITDNITQISVVMTPKDLAGQIISGIEVPLATREYSFPVLDRTSLNINEVGWYKSDWQCKVASEVVRCLGTTILKEGKHSILGLDFNDAIPNPPAFLKAKLLAPDGSVVTIVEMPYLSTEF